MSARRGDTPQRAEQRRRRARDATQQVHAHASTQHRGVGGPWRRARTAFGSALAEAAPTVGCCMALRRQPADAARTSGRGGLRENKRTWATGRAAPTAAGVYGAHLRIERERAKLAAGRAAARRSDGRRCANDL